ncbi:MAG TPA: hypothetical protein EYP59_07615 [Thiotrichaceae bacterium]|nr:hypothetical protein [Thiotrichaceae bacterium]
MKLQNTMVPVLMASAILVSGAAQAATNPAAPGTTSTGDIDITLTKNEQMQISDLADIALAVDSTGGATGTTNVCVFRSGLSGYKIKATGDSDLGGAGSTGTKFGLNPPAGDFGPTIEYTVTLSDGTVTDSPLTPGVDLSLTSANTADPTCGGAGNSGTSVTVTVDPAQYTAASNAAHTGTLTFLVSPE